MDLNQVTLPAVDVPTSVEFYRKMGFETVIFGPLYARFKTPAGHSTFSLHATGIPDSSLRADSPAWSKAIVYFECAELDQQVADIQARGLQFVQEPRDEPWQWREARILDPSGNIICLYHDNLGDSRLHPPAWRG